MLLKFWIKILLISLLCVSPKYEANMSENDQRHITCIYPNGEVYLRFQKEPNDHDTVLSCSGYDCERNENYQFVTYGQRTAAVVNESDLHLYSCKTADEKDLSFVIYRNDCKFQDSLLSSNASSLESEVMPSGSLNKSLNLLDSEKTDRDGSRETSTLRTISEKLTTVFGLVSGSFGLSNIVSVIQTVALVWICKELNNLRSTRPRCAVPSSNSDETQPSSVIVDPSPRTQEPSTFQSSIDKRMGKESEERKGLNPDADVDAETSDDHTLRQDFREMCNTFNVAPRVKPRSQNIRLSTRSSTTRSPLLPGRRSPQI